MIDVCSVLVFGYRNVDTFKKWVGNPSNKLAELKLPALSRKMRGAFVACERSVREEWIYFNTLLSPVTKAKDGYNTTAKMCG